MTEAYPHILSPVRLGAVELPNRVVRTAHGTGLASDLIDHDLIAFHRARAEGGIGLTIIEATSVHPSGYSPTGARSWDDSTVAGYQRLREALRDLPMRLMVQLFHGGYTALPFGGGAPWSASAIPAPDSGVVSLAMSRGQIDEMVEAFADAARRAVEGGLDGVEVHAGHGYLIGQFLSPLTNHRGDDYGGTVEGRRRLLFEILEAVRDAVPRGFPVGVRLSAADGADGGLTKDDAIDLAQILQRRRLIDFLDVSLGSRYAYTDVIGGMEHPDGYELKLSAPVAQSVSVPAIVAGRIRTLEQADRIIRDGLAELVSMVRATLADPALVAKSQAGQPRRIRPCIGCNDGCVGGLHGPERRVGCTVNPLAGREGRMIGTRRVRRAEEPVAVVGGGPCGMEAARVIAEAGIPVTLFEASGALGGQLAIARRAPWRSDIGEIADWLADEIEHLGVQVCLNCAITPADLHALGACAVIVATGSRPRTDGFQSRRPATRPAGVSAEHVHTSWDVLTGRVSPTGRVVVADDVGHYEAVAVAEHLLSLGARVTLATSLPRLAARLEPSHVDEAIKRRLSGRSDFDLLVDVLVEAIEPGAVTLAPVFGGAARSLDADAVVLGGHNVPSGAAFAAHDPTLLIVGDALSPRFLRVAIHEGHMAGVRVCSTDP